MEISEVPWDQAGGLVGLCLLVQSESPLPRSRHATDLVENNKGKHKMSLTK